MSKGSQKVLALHPEMLGAQKGPVSRPSRLLRQDASSEVWQVTQDTVILKLSDRPGLNIPIEESIPHRAAAITITSGHWFDLLTKLRIPHNFQKLNGDTEMLFDRVDEAKRPKPSNRKNRLIPLRLKMNYRLTEDMIGMIKEGNLNPSYIGMQVSWDKDGLKAGQELSRPYIQVFPGEGNQTEPLSTDVALRTAGINRADFDRMLEIANTIDEKVQEEIQPRGLIQASSEKRFAFGKSGEIMVVEPLDTPETDTLLDAHTLERGDVSYVSPKDYLNAFYRKQGYFDSLEAARMLNTPVPKIPKLPPYFVDDMTKIYERAIGGMTGTPYAFRKHPEKEE